MMFLTKIIISQRQALSIFRKNNYDWHRFLWKSFPNENERNFLFRTDETRDKIMIFMFSKTEPVKQDIGDWETRQFPSSFFDQNRYQFKIKVNPTYQKNGKRHSFKNEEEINNWITKKATKSGFEIQNLSVKQIIEETFYKKNHKGKHLQADLEGILQVTNKEKFKQTIKEGLGPAKAFGHGLLMLKPTK